MIVTAYTYYMIASFVLFCVYFTSRISFNSFPFVHFNYSFWRLSSLEFFPCGGLKLSKQYSCPYSHLTYFDLFDFCKKPSQSGLGLNFLFLSWRISVIFLNLLYLSIKFLFSDKCFNINILIYFLYIFYFFITNFTFIINFIINSFIFIYYYFIINIYIIINIII